MEANQTNAIAILRELDATLDTPDVPDENLAIELYRGDVNDPGSFWVWLNSDGVPFRKE